MQAAFFPNAPFGWAASAVLVGFLVLASVADSRTIRIPKWISLGLLGAGLLFQLIRGAWLGAMGRAVWQLAPHGAVVGAVDALFFGLAGFALGFILMLALFAAGGCGGGDVKLFAAVSVWAGAWLALWIFV